VVQFGDIIGPAGGTGHEQPPGKMGGGSQKILGLHVDLGGVSHEGVKVPEDKQDPRPGEQAQSRQPLFSQMVKEKQHGQGKEQMGHLVDIEAFGVAVGLQSQGRPGQTRHQGQGRWPNPDRAKPCGGLYHLVTPMLLPVSLVAEPGPVPALQAKNQDDFVNIIKRAKPTPARNARSECFLSYSLASGKRWEAETYNRTPATNPSIKPSVAFSTLLTRG